MVWAHFDNLTQKWTYQSGGSPYDRYGPGGKQIAHEGGQHYTYSTGGVRWDWIAEPPSSTPRATGTPPADASVVTGIDPGEIHNALYGKIIPLSALGLARIGTAGLIYGPYMNAGAASFGVTFGFPANPEGTRRVYEVALDSMVAWELAAGSPAGSLDAAGFLADPFTCRFYSGTQTQGADPLEAARFGAQAVAYRPQMMLWFENLPLTPFGGKVPFVSCKIGDDTGAAVPADGINLGDALESIASSPWLELDDTFEATGVADIVQAMILTEDQSFLDLLRVTARIYRTLDILQTDKLRVNDRGMNVTPDLTLDRDRIVAESGVQYTRQEEASVPRELELITIDPDADYVFMPSKAARPLAPVPVTSSKAKETMTLPVVIGATTRAALVTYAKYDEDNARKRIALQAMLYGYELEPGDLFNLSNVADGFDPGEVWKVVETSHGANYVNEIVGEAILKCALVTEIVEPGTDPYFDDVVLLLHANSDSPVADHSDYAATMSFYGHAHIDTGIKKFGAGSFAFDGTGDMVSTAAGLAAQYSISPTNTSPYTIELWARFAVVAGAIQILVCRDIGLSGLHFNLHMPAGSDELEYNTSSDAYFWTATTTTAAANLTADVWYHIAVDKDSTGKVRIYVNGVMRGSDTPANSVIATGVTAITVGATGLLGGGFAGNIEDVRITTVSRYGDVSGDASFAVPTAQFPDSV